MQYDSSSKLYTREFITGPVLGISLAGDFSQELRCGRFAKRLLFVESCHEKITNRRWRDRDDGIATRERRIRSSLDAGCVARSPPSRDLAISLEIASGDRDDGSSSTAATPLPTPIAVLPSTKKERLRGEPTSDEGRAWIRDVARGMCTALNESEYCQRRVIHFYNFFNKFFLFFIFLSSCCQVDL